MFFSSISFLSNKTAIDTYDLSSEIVRGDGKISYKLRDLGSFCKSPKGYFIGQSLLFLYGKIVVHYRINHAGSNGVYSDTAPCKLLC